MGSVTSTKRLRVFWLLDTLRGRPLLVNWYLDQKSRKEQPLTSSAMAESLQKQHPGEQRDLFGAKEMIKVPHQMNEKAFGRNLVNQNTSKIEKMWPMCR